MKRKGEAGSITIFLSIILLVMITLAGAITDAARINISRAEAQRAAETSLRSALAGYCSPLKEQYGLFALGENDKDSLKEIIEDYLNKNLMIDKEYLDENRIGAYADLYDYKIESIEVEPIFNLTENPVTRQQILEYMKYRAPKNFIQSFINKLEAFKKAGTTSEAYGEKIDFEKKLKKIDSIQREIYKNIYGKYESRILWLYEKKTMKYYVRKLDEREYGKLIDEYIDIIYEYRSLKKRLEKLDEMIEEAESEGRKKNLRERKKEIKESLKESIKDMQQRYEELIYDTNRYKEVNKGAREKINELIRKSKDLRKDLKEYKAYLEKNEEGIMKESLEQLKLETEEYEKQISYGEGNDGKNNLDKISLELDKNEKSLDKDRSSSVINIIKKIEPSRTKKLAEENLDEKEIKEVESAKRKAIKRIKEYYNEIEYDYLIKDRKTEYKKYDKRKEVQEAANEKIKVDDKEKDKENIVIGNEEYEILPSVLKTKADKEKKKSGLGFLEGYNGNEGEKGIEFYEEEQSGFGESALSYMGKITEDLDLKNIRDEIYINEYIMGSFKNYVSDIDREYSLRNLEKSSLDTYFNKSEVEYILNGSKSEKINQTLIDSKILLTRFCFNSIHVFTCKPKNNLAAATAAAVAGWYTGGAAIPIIKTLILLGWAMEESILDLNTLKAGNEVPLYKIDDTYWQSSIRGFSKTKAANSKTNSNGVSLRKENPKKVSLDKVSSEGISLEKEKPSEGKELYTSYQDYLRFFLLVQDKDITMDRIQDLIQLNMQKAMGDEHFRLDEFNTYIKLEAVISIKYLFLTQSFIPKELKTEDNRHKFKIVIYQGY